MLASPLNHAIIACEQALIHGRGFEHACQRLGNVLQSMGRFQEAVLWHTRALYQQPNPAEIYAGLAGLYAKQEQWQQSIAAYQQVLSLNPNHAEAHRSLASIYAQLGERETAIAYRYQAVSLNPSWATPNNQVVLGNALLEVNKPEAAIECYQRAVQLRPNFCEVHYNLGVVFVQQQKWQEAIAAFRQALTLNPAYAAAHYGLGKVAEAQEQWQTAIEHYRQAVTYNSDFGSAFYSLGEMLLKLRYWQEAVRVYRRVVQLAPESSWSHHYLGYALLKCEQLPEAVESLRRSIALNQHSVWTYYHLGDALSQQQQWREAAANLLQAIELQTDITSAYPILGYVLRQQMQLDHEATLRFYQQAMPLHPERQTLEFYCQIAQTLLQSRQPHAAALFYHLGLILQPDRADTQKQLQVALVQQQQLDAEIAAYRQKIRQHPNLPAPMASLGNLLADQGERGEAIALIRQASVLQGWRSAAARHYQFSHDWFTHNIPIWTEHLKPFAHYPHTKALEIGSFEGMSTCWLLDHILTHPTADLTCIDHYFQDKFDDNITQTQAFDKLTKLTGDSHACLSTLTPESYDLIYIDGCHLANHVQKDAALSWRLLKVGGLIIFDDYGWTDPNYPGQDCKIGIDAFLASVSTQIKKIHHSYQLIIQKLYPV